MIIILDNNNNNNNNSLVKALTWKIETKLLSWSEGFLQE